MGENESENASAEDVGDAGIERYNASDPTHGGYGMPRGPLLHIPKDMEGVAIGFCPQCESNARETCYNRGVFDCPGCTLVWYDSRVGKQMRGFDDYFSSI